MYRISIISIILHFTSNVNVWNLNRRLKDIGNEHGFMSRLKDIGNEHGFMIAWCMIWRLKMWAMNEYFGK
jgi:hypothetical protein